MPDGSIKFDVKLDTENFSKDLNTLTKSTLTALNTLDEAIVSGAVSGLNTLDGVLNSSFAQLMNFSEEEQNFLINASKSAAKTEQERQNSINKIRRNAATEELRKLTDEERIKQEIIGREYNQLKNRLDLGLISQEEYYLKLREYRDKYFTVGSKEWEEYTIEILTFCKKTAETIAEVQKKAILSVFEDMSKKVSESSDELLKTQEKMEQKLKDYGNLYNEKSFTSLSSGNTYSWLALSDIEKDISVLTNYNNSLKETKELLYKTFPISGEGISQEASDANKQYIKEFFSEIADMSVEEGLTFSAFLNRLPQADVTQYLSSWSKKQNLAKEISKNLYSDDAMELYNKNIENMAKDMITKLEESFGDLPDNFFEEGIMAALGFGDGFISSIHDVFNNIRSQIDLEFSKLIPSSFTTQGNTVIENSTSYNIYGNSSAKSTALEIYKYDQIKRMLVGEYQ